MEKEDERDYLLLNLQNLLDPEGPAKKQHEDSQTLVHLYRDANEITDAFGYSYLQVNQVAQEDQGDQPAQEFP